MEIQTINMPSFKKIKVFFEGSLSDKFKLLVSSPPRVRLSSDMVITLSDDTKIVVPIGFCSDGASIPRFLWAIPGFSPFGVIFPGGLPHDFAYQYGYLLAFDHNGTRFSTKDVSFYNKHPGKFKGGLHPIYTGMPQKFFDQVLRDVCYAENKARFIPSVAYWALRKFGFKAWNFYRRKGPGAYNWNSLDLPGIKEGEQF